MSRFRSTVRTLWVGGGAFAGLIVAHCLSYVAVAPEQHHRQELLHATGHGDWKNMWLLAGAFFVAALVAFAGRWTSCSDGVVPLRVLYRHAWLRLVPLQVVGFILLESAERLSKQTSPAEMAAEPVVLWGVVLQVVVALAGGLLLVGFTRLVRALRDARPLAATSQATPLVPIDAIVVLPSPARCAWNLRGPPVLFRSP